MRRVEAGEQVVYLVANAAMIGYCRDLAQTLTTEPVTVKRDEITMLHGSIRFVVARPELRHSLRGTRASIAKDHYQTVYTECGACPEIKL